MLRRLQRAQVHIMGYGGVPIGGEEFEVDMISFDMVIKINVLKIE